MRTALKILVGTFFAGAEGIGLVGGFCILTGGWPGSKLFQASCALASLACFLHHKYVRQNTWI